MFDRPFTESATAWDSTIDGFLTDEESPNFEQTVQPRTVDDDDIPKPRDKPGDRGHGYSAESDMDMSGNE